MTSTAESSTKTPSEATFDVAPGSMVIVRDEDWLVTSVIPATDGRFINVVGISELVRDTEATFSTALDTIVVADPATTRVVADASPRYRRTRLWLEAMLRKTPVPIATDGLTVSTQALADPLPYQHNAVRKALDPENLRPRILLADAVGLGKTLEIGMILSELVRRGRGEKILVVTPKAVLEQMQFELWTRFALPFVRLDSTGLQRIRQELPANRNPFTYFKRVIISIDTLKSDKYVPYLRHHRWDAVVIDESHNVTNSATLNNRLATVLANQTDALILASATPHNGKPESFAELIRMLEPSAVKPDNTLDEEQVKRLIIRRHRHSPDVAGVVGSDWAERKEPDNQTVAASEIEEEIARELEDTWLWPDGGRSPYSAKAGNALFPWTLAKAFLSSSAALEETVKNRLKTLEGKKAAADAMMVDDVAPSLTLLPGEALPTSATPSATAERTALNRLQGLAQRSLIEASGKYDALLAHLRAIGVGRGSETRVVIFSERVPTLTWLQAKLAKDLGLAGGDKGSKIQQIETLHGGLSDVEQQKIVESFKLASSPIRVLVTGDVASEGVNLHSQCHHLVHYDIPWSLIRIEQRNGRVDRYGQKHPPQITTLLLQPRTTRRFGGDIRVLAGLVDREHHAHKALGDTASLMGKFDVVAEEKAIAEVLRQGKALDDAVATPEAVLSGNDDVGVLARLMALGETAVAEESAGARAVELGLGDVARTGIYGSDLDFLQDALEEVYGTPGQEPDRNGNGGGVAWTTHPQHALASLKPPKDLKQRLSVLPQSYLADRSVTKVLKLATTPAKGKRELDDARDLQAETDTAWPEAHYLSPLHPVLEWVSDRALAELGRNQVFAVRGDVDAVTVLVQARLTNTRGQVVATSYTTEAFPNSSNLDAVMSQPHESAAAAIEALAVGRANTGPIPDPETLQRYVAAAVGRAQENVAHHVLAVEAETKERVAAWQGRAKRWRMNADALFSREVGAARKQLDARRAGVQEEDDLATEMVPDQTLVRPLLVVVPMEDV